MLHTCRVLYSGLKLSPSPPADTPIEEFTPTPAFPALQYLESVDEGGVAWRAGLRMGDFLIEVGPPPWQTGQSLLSIEATAVHSAPKTISSRSSL